MGTTMNYSGKSVSWAAAIGWHYRVCIEAQRHRRRAESSVATAGAAISVPSALAAPNPLPDRRSARHVILPLGSNTGHVPGQTRSTRSPHVRFCLVLALTAPHVFATISAAAQRAPSPVGVSSAAPRLVLSSIPGDPSLDAPTGVQVHRDSLAV